MSVLKLLYIFDLDGTLIDSKRDIAVAVNHTLESLGEKTFPSSQIEAQVGSGVKQLFEGLKVPSSKIEAAILAFHKFYLPACLVHTHPYPHVLETLKRLSQRATLAVFTNKPARYTHLILKGLKMDHFFKWVICGEDDAPKKPDPTGIYTLLEKSGISKDQTLFVGDSHIDAEVSRRAGVDYAFVTYGFGKREEVEKDPKKYVWDSFSQVS